MRILVILARLHKDEAGQNVFEYALILTLVGFASTACSIVLAKGLNTALNEIEAWLTLMSNSHPSAAGIRLH